MKVWTRMSRAVVTALGMMLAMPAGAGEGHDHGSDAVASRALPRVETSSELFELVGVVEGNKITLFLDRFADNAPVENAKIELETSALKLVAVPGEDQTYVIELPAPLAPGDHPMTFTVAAGKDTDLLTGTFHAEAASAAKGADAHHSHEDEWRAMLGYAGWAVAALFGIFLLVTRRARRTGSVL